MVLGDWRFLFEQLLAQRILVHHQLILSVEFGYSSQPMADAQLDRLVDDITRRVQGKLGGAQTSSAPASAPSAGGDCSVPSGTLPTAANCDSCRGCHVKRPEQVRSLVQLGASRIAAGVGHGAPDSDLAQLIDHTLLKPDATRDQLKTLCDEARRHHFKTVCVNASNIRYCAAQLEGSGVMPIAVVGFPLGAGTANSKAFEAREAVRNGAQEIDTVINIGAMKSKNYAVVLDDIAAVVAASAPRPVKVILETASLDHDEKVIACSLAKIAGAAFVKTSTGFGAGGATAEDVALMRNIVGPEMGVKASGGVRSADDVRRMVSAGATRVGASASVEIVSGKTKPAAKNSKGRARSGGY